MKQDTSVKPFFDDYDPKKGFHKILYRPSRAVQVRELNQMQSIFEEQIARFGDHTFLEGSVVIPGELNYDLDYSYVKVSIANLSSVKGLLVPGVKLTSSNGVSAILDRFEDASGSNPTTFYLKYMNSSTNGLVNKFQVNETLSVVSPTDVPLTTASVLEEGIGSKVTVNAGVYYIGRKFVYTPEQTVILERYSNTPSRTVGFLYEETTVTEIEDTSLYDNAQGSPNHTAPGAARLKVDIILTAFDTNQIGSLPENYVEIFRIENGEVQRRARGPEYNIINDVMAQRTYEESGNYTVKSFRASFKEHLNDGTNGGVYLPSDGGDASKFVVQIGPGLAYVGGYRVENISTVNLARDKARTTAVINNSSLSVLLGQYLVVEDLNIIPDVKNLEKLTFYSGAVSTPGSTPAGTILGTGRVRYITKDGSKYRLYLFDIRNAAGEVSSSFVPSAQSLYAAGADPFTANITEPVLLESNNNSLVFSLNVPHVKSLLNALGNSDTSFGTVKQLTGTTDSNGDIVFSSNPNEIFVAQDPTHAFGSFTDSGELFDVVGNYTLGGVPLGSTITLELGSGKANRPLRVNLQVIKEQTTQKIKTVTNASLTGSPTAGKLSLQKADVFRINSILDNTGKDVTDLFDLEPNKTSSFYDVSYITHNATNYTAPVTVNFDYFAHSPGDYFSVDSYSGVAYEDIPVENGLRLSDALDFRPRISNDGTSFTGTGAVVGNIPSPFGIIRTDIEHYLGRYDRIYVDSKGVFGAVAGTPSLNPKEPEELSGTMTLYTLYVPPYTFNTSSIIGTKVNNKRYTMKDIGKLENRIYNIEYYVSLSALETEALNKQILDASTGINRFKNGFFVDSFLDNSNFDANWSLSGVSTSPLNGGALRPEFSLNAVDMDINSNDSSGVVVKDNLVMLPYTHATFITQNMASSYINVNPYAIYRWSGHITLTPSSDTWIDTRVEVDTINVTEVRGSITTEWDGWQTSWTGVDDAIGVVEMAGGTFFQGAQDLRSDGQHISVGGVEGIFARVGGIVTNTTVSTSTETVSNRVIDTSVIPFMRSRDVTITGKGNRPRTKMHFFFDGTNINQFVRPAASGNYGDPVITDLNGDFEAIFRIPNGTNSGFQTRDNFNYPSTSVRFSTGEKRLVVTDDPTNDRVSATSYGEATFTSHGVIETRRVTVVATRVETTDIRVTTWEDPIAQSFLVASDGGAFISKIDLYFFSKDENVPVQVDIREMENGIPTNRRVPGSIKLLNPSQVNTSEDGSLATTFEFDRPVYLLDNTEYCFVISSNSNMYNVFIATMGETDIETQTSISKQPYAGVMFKSQNSSTWTEDQNSDVKFVMYKAQFSTNQGVVYFNNAEFPLVGLTNNPFTTTNGSGVITVRRPKHNYVVGSCVEVFDAVGGNGISASDLNGTQVVLSVTKDTFTFNCGQNANADGRIGGDNVKVTDTVQASVIAPNVFDLKFPDTSLVYEIKGTTGKSPSGSETPYNEITTWQTVTNKANNELAYPWLIGSRADELANTSNKRSMNMRVFLKSDNPNVSPILDAESVVLITPFFLVNRESTLDLTAQNNFANYRTKIAALSQPATAIRTYIDVSKPQESDIKLLARYGNTKEEVEAAAWQEMTGVVTSAATAKGQFIEQEYSLEDKPEFTFFQVMIQLKSNSSVNIPIGKRLRVIALGT